MKVLWFGAVDNPQYDAALRGLRIHWPDAVIKATDNPAQAEFYLTWADIDLVLVFLGKDAKLALKFIQATQRVSDLPLLAVASEEIGAGERALALEEGADTVIAQPWDAQEVAAKIFALYRRLSWSIARDFNSLAMNDLGLSLLLSQTSLLPGAGSLGLWDQPRLGGAAGNG